MFSVVFIWREGFTTLQNIVRILLVRFQIQKWIKGEGVATKWGICLIRPDTSRTEKSEV